MNAEIFAEWMRRQGHKVFRTVSSYWYDQGPRVFQAFPYHWLVNPSQEEVEDLLKRHQAIGLRYSTCISNKEGRLSYHAVYEGHEYGFEQLGKWAKKNVRRGLKNCQVEPISFKRLADEGWELQIDTLDRQGRKLALKKGVWKNLCLSAEDLPGFEAWGALVNGKLTASVITFQMEECGYMLFQQCHRDYLSDHVNNALAFIVTQKLISRPNIDSVLYGLHSLDAPASVDEFKFRMGYRAKAVRQRVVFHPAIAPLFNRYSHAALRFLNRLMRGSPTLAKAEGMARFYLEGKCPLEEQSCPAALLNEKGKILKRLTVS